MKQKEFDIILENRLAKIKEILSHKAKEYATTDRLHNFKVAARINNTTPAKALWGMALKHLVSVMDIIEGNIIYDDAMVDEKCGDLINYIILLESVLKEKE